MRSQLSHSWIRLSLPVCAAALVLAPNTSAGVVRLVSKNAAGVVGNGPSKNPGMTPDGRFIAFESSAWNLDPLDTNNQDDIFVRDLQTNTIERVNVSSTGVQANARSWSANLNHVRGTPISSDGRRILFTSLATNLSATPLPTGAHAFLRDRVAGTTVAIDAPITTTPNPTSEAIALSDDGNHAIFMVTNATAPIHLEWYVRDLVTGRAVLLWDQPAPNNGYDATISANGRWIVLQHQHRAPSAQNLSSEANLAIFDRDPDGNGVYDEQTAPTYHDITHVLNGESYMSPKISSNGRWIAYTELRLAPVGSMKVHRFDRDPDGNGVFDEPGLTSDAIVGDLYGIMNGVGVPITPDGRFIAHKNWIQNTLDYPVNLIDVQNATVEAVNFSNQTCMISTNAGANFALGLSADGRYVAWDTKGADLDPADTNANSDVYIVDRQASYPCDCHDVGTYGPVASNSFSLSGGALTYSGSRSFALDNLVLQISSCPPGRTGVIFYGPATANSPFGNGYRLVSPSSTGIVRLARFTIGTTGAISVPVHHASTQSMPLPLAVGTTVYFQALFSDPAGGGSGFNTTNALRFKFCP